MAEDGPAQAGAVHQSLVRILHGAHAPHDQILHLPVEGQLKPVGDEAGALLAQQHRLFTDGLIEVVGQLKQLRIGLVAGGQLHQGDQVRGIVGVGPHAPLRMGRLGGDITDQQAGGGAGIDGVGGGKFLHLGQDRPLDLQPLRAALLDELGVLHRLLHGGGQLHLVGDLLPPLRCHRLELLQGIQALVHLSLAFGQLLVIDIVQNHIQALHGKLNGPAGTDHTAAHTGHSLDLFRFHM